MGLALALALDVGGMCGKGMCQRRGREFSPGCRAVGIHGMNAFVNRVHFQISFIFLCPNCLRKRLLITVEKLYRWFVSRYFLLLWRICPVTTKGIGGNGSVCAWRGLKPSPYPTLQVTKKMMN